MLGLSRKKGESIMIGDNIEIVILDVQKDQVKIGINAPKNIGVHRKEIYVQIKQENEAAANISTKNTDNFKKLLKNIKKI